MSQKGQPASLPALRAAPERMVRVQQNRRSLEYSQFPAAAIQHTRPFGSHQQVRSCSCCGPRGPFVHFRADLAARQTVFCWRRSYGGRQPQFATRITFAVLYCCERQRDKRVLSRASCCSKFLECLPSQAGSAFPSSRQELASIRLPVPPPSLPSLLLPSLLNHSLAVPRVSLAARQHRNVRFVVDTVRDAPIRAL